MSKYLFVFRGGYAGMAEFSPEAIQEHMEKWKTWMGSLAQKGQLLGGEPLFGEGRVVHPDGLVTDGPFAEAKEVVGGYLLVEAEDIDQAAEIAKSGPIVETGGTTEVRPVAPAAM